MVSRLFYICILILAFALTALATTFFALPNGSGTACTLGSPCPLLYGLSAAGPVESGDTLCISKGINVTYNQKIVSALVGATVRSCDATGSSAIINQTMAGWAIIDGDATTTLNGAINSSVTQLTLASAVGLTDSSDLMIDSEQINVYQIVSGSTVNVTRGASGTTPASHSDGATARHLGTTFDIPGGAGTTTIYRDFEVTNSWTSRDNNGDWNTWLSRGTGIAAATNGNSFINILSHDGLIGLGTNGASSNTLIYGCLFYDNGTYDPGAGYGMYLENGSGYSRVYDTIILNNFNFGAQLYGTSASYVGGDLQGTVWAGAGAPAGEPTINLLWGPENNASPTANIDDSVFYHNAGSVESVLLGFGVGITTATVTDNYFLGRQLGVTEVTNLTLTGNKFDSSSTTTQYAVSHARAYTWNTNTYYNTTTGNDQRLWVWGGGGGTFAQWKTDTGFDASSSISSSRIADTVIVRPNSYETGRANVTIYAPTAPSSINVNLATTGLTNGQAYTIINAFNPKGTAVATGTYNSGSTTISVSLTGAATSVSTPIGMGTTAATTCPPLCVMVVLPGAMQAGIGGSARGAVSFKGAATIK